MTEQHDGDRLINLILLGLVVFIMVGIGGLVLTASFVQDESGANPDTEFGLTRINATHVRITHAGGEAVPTEDLTVTVDGIPVEAQWSSSMLTEGEYGLVRVSQATRLTLLWQHSENERDVLRQWKLSQPTTE